MATIGALSGMEHEARQRALAAVNDLQERAGLPPVDLTNRASRLPEPTPRTVGDAELLAALAEAVGWMAARLDVLEAERSASAKKGAPKP